MFPKKNEEIATARPFSAAAMAATPSLASRAAFAELLDDHWRIFRDQLLEAIPENQQAQAEVASWDKDGYENLVQIAEGALPTRSRTSGSGSEGASGSISPGGVSQVPSLPEITPKPLATHLEARSRI
ncbi:unnamed protein product [Cladocopium goreaui]|uniref:Uncharacterized protein n=1 Tax=Cladocopium goreaui TaxID=2562237 RepID=A0A9P1CC44_9DINO|nr:unnamed protein product [Cladocopium goreaui]